MEIDVEMDERWNKESSSNSQSKEEFKCSILIDPQLIAISPDGILVQDEED